METGRADNARSNLRAAIDAARRVGDLKFAANSLSNLGWLEHLAGQADAARAHFDSALAIAREIGHRHLECIVLCNLGVVLDGQGRPVDALVYLEQSIAMARELQDRRSEGQFLGYRGLALAHALRFVESRSDLDAAEVLLSQTIDPVSQALLLCMRAEVERLDDRADAARRYLELAERQAKGLAAGSSSELGLALMQARGHILHGAPAGSEAG
jgi:ATP/maltotriose-dependent transcriptional regulator MalT